MSEQNPVIVVVAFNRQRSLKRLLGSLEKAHYSSKDITLIISIDAADNNQDVLAIANEFQWAHGEKQVIYQPENLGLRKHILKCGDYSLTFGSVIVLEDDLYVSPNFYNYALAALSFSNEEDYIGGVSLYNHQVNVHTYDNFSAIEDGFDNWYFQFASSWGQAWTANQWKTFKSWYENNQEIVPNPKIPDYVANWSNKSWLKYFIVFLIQTDRYFLYPKISLTTNFGDAGTHVEIDSGRFQVPFALFKKEKWDFSKIDKSRSIYDAYYENKTLFNFVGVPDNDLTIDLYSYKKESGKRFLLTRRILNYKILRTYGKLLKPIDCNIIENIQGNDLFLYDTDIVEVNKNKGSKKKDILYNIKGLSYQDTSYLALQLIKERVILYFRKFKR